MLFGGVLIAILVKYTFPYHWSWLECLLFGAVLGATDPVAVAAILSEVGPRRLLQAELSHLSFHKPSEAFTIHKSSFKIVPP